MSTYWRKAQKVPWNGYSGLGVGSSPTSLRHAGAVPDSSSALCSRNSRRAWNSNQGGRPHTTAAMR